MLEAAGQENYFIMKLSATSNVLTSVWQPSYLKIERRPNKGNRTRSADKHTSPRDSWSFQGRLAVPAFSPLFTEATNNRKFLILMLDGNNIDYLSSVSFPPGYCVGITKKNRNNFVCTKKSSNSTEATLKLVESKRQTTSSLRVYKIFGRVRRDHVFSPVTADSQVVLDFNSAVYWQPRPLLPCKHSRNGGRITCS